MQSSKSSRLPILAIGSCLMVLPALVFLMAAALRLLQPRQYEPARTSWLIFEWTTTHVSQIGAAVLFIGMPAIVVMAAGVTLLTIWGKDQALRNDVSLALTILRRHAATGVLTTVTLLAGAILTLAAVHIFTD